MGQKDENKKKDSSGNRDNNSSAKTSRKKISSVKNHKSKSATMSKSGNKPHKKHIPAQKEGSDKSSAGAQLHAQVHNDIKIGDRLSTDDMPRTNTQTHTHTKSSSGTSTAGAKKKSETEFSHKNVSHKATVPSFINNTLKKKWIKFALASFAVLLVIYIAYQIYLNYYSDAKVETVNITTYSETIDTEGISIRDEAVINKTLSGSAVNTVDNGAKVSKGQTIINVFNSAQAASAYERIAEIDKEMAELQSMTTASEDSATEVGNIEKQLDEQISKLTAYVNNGNLSKVAETRANITYLMNKRLVAMRRVDGYEERIEALNKEKESLKKTYSEAPSAVKAPASGYYVNSLDGYENLLNTAMLDELTASGLNNIMNQTPAASENSTGKLINGFTWYLACPVSAKDAEDYLSEGSVYTLILPYSETGSMQATLIHLNEDETEKGQLLAIFSCRSLMSELCSIRRQPVKIQIRSYTGFAVKKSALHIGTEMLDVVDEDGNVTGKEQATYPCVYVLLGNQVVSKRVNILYNGDKITICSAKENGSNYLSLYDKVITEGKGLYAGKIIN